MLVFLPPSAANDTKDEEGNTALHIAVKKGNMKIAEMLIGMPGIDVNVRNNDQSTPLHLAAEKGDDEMVSVGMTGGQSVFRLQATYVA